MKLPRTRKEEEEKQDMQAPKGVQIGEFNDSLAQPHGYLYD